PRRRPDSTLFPYTTLFRSETHLDAAFLDVDDFAGDDGILAQLAAGCGGAGGQLLDAERNTLFLDIHVEHLGLYDHALLIFLDDLDRKSTRLNSSHVKISYA